MSGIEDPWVERLSAIRNKLGIYYLYAFVNVPRSHFAADIG